MTVEFFAECDPSESLLSEIASLEPTNPFHTPNYSAAMQLLGYQPVALLLRDGEVLQTGCTAFAKSGRFNKSLEIISLPQLDHSDTFWSGLLEFCRNSRVSNLEIGTFGSGQVTIPMLSDEIQRQPRCEHILNLDVATLWENLSSNHRRNLKSGKKAGLVLEQVTDEESCLIHASLISESMTRRKLRGEEVSAEVAAREFAGYLKTGAGKLFQSKLDGKAVSSIMVMMSEKGAYYQSAGSSSTGMSMGGSTFLICNLAELLKSNIQIFNLGGASDENPGLLRFKSGFGTVPITLESASFYVGSRTRKTLTSTLNIVKRTILKR